MEEDLASSLALAQLGAEDAPGHTAHQAQARFAPSLSSPAKSCPRTGNHIELRPVTTAAVFDINTIIDGANRQAFEMSTTLRRRQNHSCDQCKRSKKACDGYAVNQVYQRSTSSPTPSSMPTDIKSCSYCVRTRKRCTLNKYWGAPDGLSSQTPASSDTSRCNPHQGLRIEGLQSSTPNTLTPDYEGLQPGDALDFLQMPTPSHASFPWQTPGPNLDYLAEDDADYVADFMELGDDISQSHFGIDAPTVDSGTSGDFEDLPYTEAPLGTITSNIPRGTSGLVTTDWVPSPSLTSTSVSTTSRVSIAQRAQDARDHHRRRRLAQLISCHKETAYPALLSGVNNAIMSKSNNYLITESLLRIYHDVLENNLACWITEDTCPYQMRRRGPSLSIETSANASPEWGMAWSNRMYRRVKQLDRVAQSQGLVRLTGSENRAASKALELSIMAFATQWSQGIRRREKFPSTSPQTFGDSSDDLADDLRDHFEENLQQSIWEQAKQALQNVSHLESYRVVYAELIFGLINKPWAATPDSPGPKAQPSPVLAYVKSIMEEDGPPVCLERATRKMHAMKYRLEAEGMCNEQHRGDASQDTALIGAQERGTVGLLYWLAVMFDTVSSSMNERPVIVPDEECQHDEAKTDAASPSQTTNPRWELDLYAQEDSSRPNPIQWPCSYEEATRAVARSAAVKVLLFRYVSYLQNAVRKRRSSDAVEDIISSIMSVYRYWNRTHGSFFRDLVRNYDDVPSRIKSWFPCIGIPWHLGSLMVADLIVVVDANGMGQAEAEGNRLKSDIAQKIRRSSAIDLADLARVTTPASDDITTEQLSDFHFAVNEGPLLTEPWTVLLVRAFTKATMFFLAEMEEKEQELATLGQGDGIQECLDRGELCIRALWFLGRKSEMARGLAKVLYGELKRKTDTHLKSTA